MEEKPVEIKQVSEREIWVGESRFYLGEDNIIYATPVGDIDEETAITFKKNVFKLLSIADGKVDSLVDLNKVKPSAAAARNIGKDAFQHEKVGKLAIFGVHPVAKMLASFLMGACNKKNMHFFKTKEEALEWLKE